MPQVAFDEMPASARLWVFGASTPLEDKQESQLLDAVDSHLAQWRAHGVPLVCAREWRDNRFLAIAVNEEATGASGCSIDGLFRVLASLEEKLDASIVAAGRVFWRGRDGIVRVGTRSEFAEAGKNGEVALDSAVFDLTVANVGDWRSNFERPASSTWHSRLLAG